MITQQHQKQHQQRSGAPPQMSPSGPAKRLNFIVSAGQWARLTVEQRLDGEYVTLLSKPLVAVATTAATKARDDRSVSENLT